MDDGSELLKGSGEDCSSLVSSGEDSSLLVSGLVEPRLNEARPVLTEVVVWELVVVLNHLGNLYIQ